MRDYGEARFLQRHALLKDELMLERLAEYGELIAAGIAEPVISELNANAYPLQIAKYFKVTKGVAAVVGSAGRLFEDFQVIASHLLQDLGLEPAKREESLVWISNVCPSGLATLWEACLQAMLQEPKSEEQQEIKQNMLDKLREHLLETPKGSVARRINNEIQMKKTEKKQVKEKLYVKEKDLKEETDQGKKIIKHVIKELKEDIQTIDNELKVLQEEMKDASQEFQHAMDAFDNILDRLYRVTVEVEVQLHIGSVISNVCGPRFTQLLPKLVAFRHSHNELEKQLLEPSRSAPLEDAEVVMAKLVGGVNAKMDKFKALTGEPFDVD